MGSSSGSMEGAMEAEIVPNGTIDSQEGVEAKEERSTKSTSKRLLFTVNRQEMLESVGITTKILRTWSEAGIFVPDLGPGTRRFTARDVARLRFLNHLRGELGLSTE